MKRKKRPCILIAESEPEILFLFKICSDPFGIDSVIVDNCEAAVKQFLSDKNKRETYYDLTISDTHL